MGMRRGKPGMTSVPVPAVARWTVHLLPIVLLLLVFAVAHAPPVEALYLKGIQDGGDYDSLIQPLLLGLAALPESSRTILIPLGASTDWVGVRLAADPPLPGLRAAESRAPPVL